MSLLSRFTGLFRPAPVAQTFVSGAGEIDQAFNGLTNAIIKNSQGIARTRILAAAESLRSAVKATNGSD